MAIADKLIVALDFKKESEAYDLVKKLYGLVSYYKVGLSLFCAVGPSIIVNLKDMGVKVFLDLKFHDIPNTVADAVESAALSGIDMLSIHISGGKEMISAAVNRLKKIVSPPLLLGVTVLTSQNQEVITAELGISRSLYEQVISLAVQGQEAGLGGVIASPQEIKSIRNYCGSDFKIITPGIRPSWASSDDQKRFLSPAQAVSAGADYIVMGRPITKHFSPRRAATLVLEEIKNAAAN